MLLDTRASFVEREVIEEIVFCVCICVCVCVCFYDCVLIIHIFCTSISLSIVLIVSVELNMFYQCFTIFFANTEKRIFFLKYEI